MTTEANQERAATSLRICCYGSSSSRTPQRYLSAAYDLGRLLGRRGHTCVNGAGSSGCMAEMNRGADDAGGRIVGVIHEAFVVDGSDWYEGAHSVFRSKSNEILIASGNDLRERKRLLVEGADALVVLPGGPGTWDELWEMACARHVGFHSMPIVCVNVEGYYDNFRQILQRAHEDELLYKHPRDILHFEETPEAAVKWIEAYLSNPNNKKQGKLIKRRSSILKRLQSNVSGSSLTIWGRMSMTSFFGDEEAEQNDDTSAKLVHNDRVWHNYLATFSAGLSLGLFIASRMSSSSVRA